MPIRAATSSTRRAQSRSSRGAGGGGGVAGEGADEEGGHLGDTEPYDAIVLDLGLPKIDGVSVLQRWREAGQAIYWKVYGRNKRSLVLDLKAQGDLETLKKLMRHSQVLVENFVPGRLEKMLADYGSAKTRRVFRQMKSAVHA